MSTTASNNKQKRREALLDSARAVFGEKGYHAAKVGDIVERAGVAHGTFYLYFDNKRATFVEILDDLVRRLDLAIERIDPTGPIHAQVLRNVERALGILHREPDLARILLTHATGVDPELDERVHAFYDRIAGMLEDAIRLGEAMGIVRPCDARLASYALLGATKEVIQRVALGGFDAPLVCVAEAVLNQSLYGLLVRDGDPRAAARVEELEPAGAGRSEGGSL